jgi:hypothetical protein
MGEVARPRPYRTLRSPVDVEVDLAADKREPGAQLAEGFGDPAGQRLIAGPRTMKTTSYAVPAILDAPGAVIATSNKRDIVDVTRSIRSEAGDVWVFDPQAVAEEAPSWWWNPLTYVKKEATAGNMAQHFANGSREPGTKPDAYFDPAGQKAVSCEP